MVSECLIGPTDEMSPADAKLNSELVIVPAPPQKHEQERIEDGEVGGVADELVIRENGGENAHLIKRLPNEEALPLHTVIDGAGDKFGNEDTLPSPVIPGPAPPDGGLRAWIVMLSSFLCNGIIFGTINSLGIIFYQLRKILEDAGEKNPASMASLTLSLAIGTTFFLSMVAGILTDKLGIRVTTVLGGALATIGMFLSSMYYTQSNILLVSLGIIFGTGSSLAYTPSLVILGHYFHRRLGIVNGFVTAGSSVFTIIMSELLRFVIEKHGLKAAFQMLTGFMSVLMLCGFVFKPLLPDISPQSEVSSLKQEKGRGSRFINLEIWRNKRYVIWALAIPSALFGYFVPYVHLVTFAKEVLGKESNTQVLVQCIGLTSGAGRLFFGLISDKPWVNRIFLQQISFFCIGVLTMLLVTANKLWVFILISLLMGLFDGCFISLLGPIAFDIVGPSGASQAIGCLLAFCSIPLTLGPFIAGLIYDMKKSYLIPFLCAGIPPILGAFVLFSIRCVKQPSEGPLGSPKRDSAEMKNNVAIANSEGANSSLPEAQALMLSDNNQAGADFLQVDVRHLVNLQRESSV